MREFLSANQDVNFNKYEVNEICNRVTIKARFKSDEDIDKKFAADGITLFVTRSLI